MSVPFLPICYHPSVLEEAQKKAFGKLLCVAVEASISEMGFQMENGHPIIREIVDLKKTSFDQSSF